MRIRIINCPKNDQCVAVSMTTSPVTQRAEVDVKMQVRKSVGVLSFDEIGKLKKRAPINIASKKLPIIVCVEFNLNLVII